MVKLKLVKPKFRGVLQGTARTGNSRMSQPHKAVGEGGEDFHRKQAAQGLLFPEQDPGKAQPSLE